MQKLEEPTPVAYVTLRNWQNSPSIGEEVVFEWAKSPLHQWPVLRHVNFLGYLDAVLARINPDGSIDTPFDHIEASGIERDPSKPVAIEDISSLRREERNELRDRLADRLLADAQLAALPAQAAAQRHAQGAEYLKTASKSIIRKESVSAAHLAPYRHETEFLREVADICQRAQDEDAAWMTIRKENWPP